MSEAARSLGVPASTLTTWGRGHVRRRSSGSDSVGAPLVTFVGEASGGAAVVPFVGLAEGLVLAAFRQARVPLQRIRPALQRLQREFGVEHALASQRLYTDGAEVLFDFAEELGDTPEGQTARELVVLRNNQHVFSGVVEAYLQRVEFAADDYPRLIRLPSYTVAEVVADPDRGFGQPVFVRGGARVEDALAMFRAGEPLEIVSQEFGVPMDHLQDVVRVALQPAA